MGLKLNRKKDKNILLSIFYKLFKLFTFIKPQKRLNFFLTMEWIFDRLAHEESFKVFSYDNHPIRIHTLNFIKKNIDTTDSVLDLGCNTGEISNAISNYASKVVGIDYNSQAIKTAKELFQKNNLEFINTDAFEYLAQSDFKFDIIILSHILEHIDNPKSFLEKCKAFTRKIYIELPDFDKTYLNQYRITTKNPLNYTDADHIWEFDREDMKLLIAEAGMKILESDYRFGVMKIWCETN